MQEFPVISGTLDRVTDRVTEVKKCPLACFVALVSGDDLLFNRDVALNQSLYGNRLVCLPQLKRVKHFRVSDHGVLDDLGEALVKLASGQRFQNIEVINHERRVVHSAD